MLRFRDGRFRILRVSDFHAGKSYDPKLRRGLEALLEKTVPDFVMVGGDQCLDRETPAAAGEYMADIMSPVIERKIPWAAVLGNHDREVGISVEEEYAEYERLPYFAGSAGPDGLYGCGNFSIPVYPSGDGNGNPAFVIWGLDSSLYQRHLPEILGRDESWRITLPDPMGGGASDGALMFSQVMWYYDRSLEYERTAGRKVPGAVFTHVPVQEFMEIIKNPEETGARGHMRESSCCSEISSGLFMAALERGDIRGMFFGHDHLVTLQGEYCGVTMACDGALGYNMSAHDDLRGGRVIDVAENGGLTTQFVSLWSIMGKECMRDPGYMEGGCAYFIRKL